MDIRIFADKAQLGRVAADTGATLIREAIARDRTATIVLATGASQFDVLAHLTTAPDVDWARVTVFHLDEYIGLSGQHRASFRRYLRERFLAHVPKLGAFIPVDGEASEPLAEVERLNGLIRGRDIAVCLAGIGENGHLAFNDPPADFMTEVPYLTVALDEACRRQQLGEGWFPTLDDVPTRAISMSVRQMLKARCLIVSVPDRRKAQAVHDAIEGPLTPDCPASILRLHRNCLLLLDEASAAYLSVRP